MFVLKHNIHNERELSSTGSDNADVDDVGGVAVDDGGFEGNSSRQHHRRLLRHPYRRMHEVARDNGDDAAVVASAADALACAEP